MRCSFCRKRAVYYAGHFGKAFCNVHLEQFLIKKLKREIYKGKLIKPHSSYLFLSNFSPASEASLYLLSKVVEKWPVKLYAISLNIFEGVRPWNGERVDYSIDPVTLEGETKRGIFSLAYGRFYFSGYKFNNVVRPFRKFNQKELSIIAILKGLNYEKAKGDNFLLKYLGEAAELNFLRAYDQIGELLLRKSGRGGEGRKLKIS